MSIVKLTENVLQLSLVGMGNTLNYIRANNEQAAATPKTPSGSGGSVSRSGLIPSELAGCKPIPKKWKPGTKVYNAFPGKDFPGDNAEQNKWCWMGSDVSDSLTLETTDEKNTSTIDLHVWKITIQL